MHPLVAVIVRQLPQQPAIELLGDTGRQWLAPGQVFLDARWQGGARAPVAAVTAEDAEHITPIDGWPAMPIRIARTGLFTPRITLPMAVLRLALALPLPFVIVFAVTWVGQDSTRRHYPGSGRE